MSAQAETPHKIPRRSKRLPKQSAAQAASHASSLDQNNPQIRVNAGTQPTQILRQCYPDTATISDGLLTHDVFAPETPPRPHSMYEGSAKGRNTSSDGKQDTSPRRKNPTKPQNPKHKLPSKPPPNGESSLVARPNTMTPVRASETPSKAYAGPTFHASPAASSLPLPKFFSKSVPNVDKSTSLKSMMEQEALDTTSGSEGSPFMEDAKPLHDHRDREESPLDLFFQADREAKAKSNMEALANGLSHNMHHSPAVSGVRKYDSSPCRSSSGLRHHARHHTDSSMGEMFPLEMDGTVRGNENDHSQPSKAAERVTNTDRSASAASEAWTEEQLQEEHRRAQTLALKKLLYSPRPQSPVSSSTPLGNHGSPSPKATNRHGSPALNRSNPPARASALGSDNTNRDQRQAALLALAQKQIPSTNGFTNQRPPSSSLRKEMMAPVSPGPSHTPEFPMTPTPSRVHNTHTSTYPQDRRSAPSNGSISPFGSYSPSNLPQPRSDNAPNTTSPTTKSMEDDLRRILKLDVFGSDGVAGVQS